MVEPLFLEERRRTILDQLKQQGRVSVRSLSKMLNVSAVTIRQDLRALKEEGLLERTYGGAVARSLPTTPVAELTFETRREKHQLEKAAIGKAAAALARDGDGIALDASTTAFAITPYLCHLDSLTIVTNSLMIAQQFLDSPRIHVILAGGRLRRDSISTVGNPASLPDINLTIGFFGARGLTTETGATDISLDEAEMKRSMIARCATTIIVADSDKWGQIAPYTYLPTSQITHIITCDDAPIESVERFRLAGVHVDLIPLEP